MDQSLEQENSDWLSLTEEQREGILKAYDESEDEANLIPLEAIIAKYKVAHFNLESLLFLILPCQLHCFNL